MVRALVWIVLLLLAAIFLGPLLLGAFFLTEMGY